MMINDKTTDVLFIILEDENVERIKKYDPAEVSIGSEINVREVQIMYCSPKERDKVISLIQRGEVLEVLRLLSRGYQVTKADKDGPYAALVAKSGQFKKS